MSESRTEVTRLSKKYAVALYDLAVDAKNIKNISANIKLLDDTIKSSNELQSVIASPVTLRDDIYAIFEEICKKLKLDPLAVAFCNTLISNNRMSIFEDIATSFYDIISQKNGEIKVTLVSAKKMTKSEIDKISSSIKESLNKTPIIESKIDEDIIGGLIINIGSKMLDASIKGRLDKIKTSLKTSNL